MIVFAIALLLPAAHCLHSAPLHRRHALRALAPHASPRFRARVSALVRSWPSSQLTAASAPWAISPISYGADPTGVADSSPAFDAALAALLARGTSGHADESGTVDLGGALLDLEGGDYLLSRPLSFPSNFSNFGMAHGTLRAAPSFPPGAFVVDVGTAGAPCVNWGDSCTEDVTFGDLFIDGSQVANGVRFNAVIGVNAGPDLFVVNWTKTGVDIEGGHEVLLHESWVASCWYTPPDRCWLNATALGDTTAILVAGNDHYLNQVVAFGGLNGVVVNGAANLLSGVHTWNTQVGAVPNATGILVNQWQNRLETPYLDFVPLVLAGAAITTVTDGFFLGGAQIVFRPHPSGYPVRGVFISGNQFFAAGGAPDVVAAPGAAPYSSIEDVTIVGAMSDDPATPRRSTTATVTVRNATSWAVDFAPLLVWDAADHPLQAVTHSLWGCTAPPGASFATVAGALVTVAGPPAGVACSCTVTVDQSKRLGA